MGKRGGEWENDKHKKTDIRVEGKAIAKNRTDRKEQQHTYDKKNTYKYKV